MERHWLFGERKKEPTVKREWFEEDIGKAIEHAEELKRLCWVWSRKIFEVQASGLPVSPSTSAYLDKVKSGLEEMANLLGKKIEWLKKIRSEAYRLEEV
jgi:formylmethanofuran dehydrogenase subunit B